MPEWVQKWSGTVRTTASLTPLLSSIMIMVMGPSSISSRFVLMNLYQEGVFETCNWCEGVCFSCFRMNCVYRLQSKVQYLSFARFFCRWLNMSLRDFLTLLRISSYDTVLVFYYCTVVVQFVNVGVYMKTTWRFCHNILGSTRVQRYWQWIAGTLMNCHIHVYIFELWDSWVDLIS
jgi:hypothetical protein